MKKLAFVFVILFSSGIATAQFQTATLTAAGLTCAMCSKAIYTALQKIPAVSSVDADIKSSAYHIKFRDCASVDPDELKAAVEDAGFSVARLRLTGQFDNVAVGNEAHVKIGDRVYHFLKTGSAPLNGHQTLTMVDKNYLTAKEFRKYNSSSNHPCVETGKAEECCAKAGATRNSRIYHVTL